MFAPGLCHTAGAMWAKRAIPPRVHHTLAEYLLRGAGHPDDSGCSADKTCGERVKRDGT